MFLLGQKQKLAGHLCRDWAGTLTSWAHPFISPLSPAQSGETNLILLISSTKVFWSSKYMVPRPCFCKYLIAAAAKLLQSCPTLLDSIDSSPPGSPVPGILQARTLEWVAISFSNACKWKVKVKLLSRVRLLATPWTAAHQAPPSMGFSRQEY